MAQPARLLNPEFDFAFTPGFTPTYFNVGMYLMKVKQAKLNKSGEPCLTFQVKDSPDGSKVNALRTENFLIGSQRISDAVEAARGHTDIFEAKRNADKRMQRNKEKFSDVIRAVGLEELTNMQELEGLELVVFFTEAGRDTFANYRKAEDFDKTWLPKKIREQQANIHNNPNNPF